MSIGRCFYSCRPTYSIACKLYAFSLVSSNVKPLRKGGLPVAHESLPPRNMALVAVTTFALKLPSCGISDLSHKDETSPIAIALAIVKSLGQKIGH